MHWWWPLNSNIFTYYDKDEQRNSWALQPDGRKIHVIKRSANPIGNGSIPKRTVGLMQSVICDLQDLKDQKDIVEIRVEGVVLQRGMEEAEESSLAALRLVAEQVWLLQHV